MRIYDYQGSTGYEMLHCVDSEGWRFLGDLGGSPHANTWKPVRVRRVRPSAREGFRPSDSPFFSTACLVFRRSAVDALRDILDANGELLPLDDEEGVELFAYNAKQLDALDHAQSKGFMRNEEGRLRVPYVHVFFPSIVANADIFRTKGHGGSTYVSHRFLQRWKKAKLKGLDFILAWDSELPPDQQPNVPTSKPVKMSTIK